jgi:hypothetical protein
LIAGLISGLTKLSQLKIVKARQQNAIYSRLNQSAGTDTKIMDIRWTATFLIEECIVFPGATASERRKRLTL